MFELVDKARLHFKVFVPNDPSKFKKALRYKLNMAQTILVVDGKVDSIKIGEMDGDSFTEILRKVKRILKKNRQREDIAI
ncbi:MAG: hypothetical protein PVH61_06135 [Candidatus Aminicenantes bacterium]